MALSLKSVPAARGPRWWGEAFRLFVKRPLAFTLLFVVFLFAALVVSLVPLAGGLAQMMSLPLLSLGYMVAARSAQAGGPVTPAQFVEPLRTDATRRRAILKLCVLYGLGATLILLVADHMSNQAWARLQKLIAEGDKAAPQIEALWAEPGVAAAVLVGSVLGTALSVPFWHAPALVHWGGQGVAQSLFSSTLALWRNKGAVFMYMATALLLLFGFGVLTAMLFALLGAPQMAGVAGLPGGLIFTAVFYISMLFCFDDSFATSADTPAPGVPAAPEAQPPS
jgi:hypothetical protein